jgi:predicted dehydrogenase
MKKVNVAVIGFGHLGRWHTQKAAGLENANLVAVVEPYNQEAVKEAYPDVKVVSDVKDIMDEIDAAVIVTPTSTHFELTKQLLENNKHVFCEKPLCATYDEVVQLSDKVGNNVLQVGHSERCHQAWEILEEKFKSIQGKRTFKIDRFAPFKGRATDVDVVQDLMIHDLDLMLYILGMKPVSVSAIGHKIRTDKWDHVTATFSFEDGSEAIITSGRNHVKEVRALEVMSDSGCIYVDLFANKIYEGTDSQFEDESYVKEMDYEKRDHLLIEQDRFYNSIINQTPPMVNYDDGAKAVFLVSKVMDSLDKGERLSL